MWIDRLTSSPSTRALELTADFAERRQQVLAENLANIDVPGFHQQRLDVAPFQRALGTAMEQAKAASARDSSTDPGMKRSMLKLRSSAQFATTPDGALVVRPAEEPPANVLFHDGTNAHVEKLLTDVANNALTYETAMGLLRGRYEGMLKAIRGKS